jgi:HD-like signal output (HDOD) protein
MLTLAEVTSDVQSLPVLNSVVTRLLRLLEDPDTGVSDVSDLINLDQGLTADVLKLCNSAYFGLPRKVDSIQHAAVLLGTDVLFQLTLTAIAGNYLAEARLGYALPKGALWHFSLACAIASKLLAEELNFEDHLSLYTAALLQEVGKLILDPYLEPRVEEFQKLQAEGELKFCDAEQQILGLDHAQAGGAILTAWKLPAKISQAVAWHHSPSQNQVSRDISDIIQLSDMLVESAGLQALRETACYPLDEKKFIDAGLDLERIPLLTEKLKEQLSEAEAFLYG